MMPVLEQQKYFEGLVPKTKEYNERLSYARIKFMNRQVGKWEEEMKETAKVNLPQQEQQPQQPVRDSGKSAEDFKKDGNDFIATKKYAEAIESYTHAIALNPNSSVYFANRALAYIELKKYELAIPDAEESIRLDSKYSKAYYRLGLAQLALNQKDSVASFELALKFNSGDASHINEKLNAAKNKFGLSNPSGSANPANPLAGLDMGALSGLMAGLGGAGGGAGGFDFANIMKNPAFAQMYFTTFLPLE